MFDLILVSKTCMVWYRLASQCIILS